MKLLNFCQKIRQIKVRSALLRKNVNRLWRVFSPLGPLVKFGDFLLNLLGHLVLSFSTYLFLTI